MFRFCDPARQGWNGLQSAHRMAQKARVAQQVTEVQKGKSTTAEREQRRKQTIDHKRRNAAQRDENRSSFSREMKTTATH